MAKCLARLVVGPPAEAALRSREAYFWAAIGFSSALCLLEHSALCARALEPALRPVRDAAAGAPARRTRMSDVLALCAPDWPFFVQAFCGLTVAAVGESLIPYLYGEILNEIALSADPAAFRRPMLQLVLTAAVTGLATGVRGATFTVLGARFSTRLRQRLLDALLRAELGFFDVTKTGEISSRLSADCQKVGDQVELNVNVFVRSLLQVVLTTAAMVAINWRLGLVAFVSVPPIVVASREFGAFIRALTKDYQKALADSTAVAEEALGAMRTVRAFAAEGEVSAAYGRDMARYRSLVYREAAAYFGYSALTFTFLPYCCACLVLYYGAQLVHQGGMRPGQLVSFVFCARAPLRARRCAAPTAPDRPPPRCAPGAAQTCKRCSRRSTRSRPSTRASRRPSVRPTRCSSGLSASRSCSRAVVCARPTARPRAVSSSCATCTSPTRRGRRRRCCAASRSAPSPARCSRCAARPAAASHRCLRLSSGGMTRPSLARAAAAAARAACSSTASTCASTTRAGSTTT